MHNMLYHSTADHLILVPMYIIVTSDGRVVLRIISLVQQVDEEMR